MSRNEEDVRQGLTRPRSGRVAPLPQQNEWMVRKLGARMGSAHMPMGGARARSQSSPPPLVEPLAGVDPVQHFVALEKAAIAAVPLQSRTHRPIDRALAAVRKIIRGGDRPAVHVALRTLEQAISEVTRAADARREGMQQSVAYHNELADRVKTRAALIKQGALPVGHAKRLEKAHGGGGREFKAFLTALGTAESKRDLRSIEELERAAQTYVDHVRNDFSEKKQQDADRQRKVAACSDALRHARLWKLADEQSRLGAPPWDHETEHRAGAVLSKMLFEEGEIPAKPLVGSEGGVSGAWWIERAEGNPALGRTDQRAKQFLFKPRDAESSQPGFPQGTSAPREVLGKAANDSIMSMTGLDFGVPPSFLVPIANDKLVDVDGKSDSGKLGQERLGSLQQFASSRGTIKSIMEKDPGFFDGALKHMPKGECHKLAVLDMLTLNTDRHYGNAMVQGDGPDMKLVPIDHGLCFPTREGLNARNKKLGLAHNVVQFMDAKDERLDPEMVARVRMIDPAELERGIMESWESMCRLHPEVAKDFDPRESAKLVKRSAEFLQAAAGELTVAELMTAYVVEMQAIFDSSDEDKETRFAEAINRARADGAAMRELQRLFPNQRAQQKLQNELQDLGWIEPISYSMFLKWLEGNAQTALKVHQSKLENPALRQALDEMIESFGGRNALPVDIAGLSLREQRKKLLDKRAALELTERDERLRGLGVDPVAMAKDSKDKYMLPVLRQGVDDYATFGGDQALVRLGADPRVLSFEDRLMRMYSKQYLDLGGDRAWSQLVQRFADSAIKDGETAPQILKVKRLQDLERYERLGGDKEFFGLGGDGEIASVSSRLREIQELSAAKRQATNELAGRNVEELKRTQLTRRLDRVRREIEGHPDANIRRQLTVQYRDALPDADASDYTGANGKIDAIERALSEARKTLVEMAQQDEALSGRLTQVLSQINGVRDRTAKGRLLLAYRTALQHKDALRYAECDKGLTALEKIAGEILQRQPRG